MNVAFLYPSYSTTTSFFRRKTPMTNVIVAKENPISEDIPKVGMLYMLENNMIRKTGNDIMNESTIVLARYSGIPHECVKFDNDLDMKSKEDTTAAILIMKITISNTIFLIC